MKKIEVTINEKENISIKYDKDVSALNLIHSSMMMLKKASEVTFFNDVYGILEKVFDDDDLDNNVLMASVANLATRVKAMDPNMEGEEFARRYISFLFKKDFYEEPVKSIETVNELKADEFLLISDETKVVN